MREVALNFDESRRKVAALTAPSNVVLVGASDKPGSWAARVWRNLNRYEFPGAIHLMNPRRAQAWGKPCYADFASMPERPDHLIVLVPAAQVCDTLRAGAAAGARSATIFSSGFGEAYDEAGLALGRELRKTIADTGLAVSGPNCMGNICAKTHFVTLTEDRSLDLCSGPVALVGQSGGVMIFVNQALEERGLIAPYLITSGNEAGLSVADYVAFFASEPEIKVIVVYIEALKDAAAFAAACRLAREAGKAIVAIKLGQSEAGRGAALAHTGSLAGSMEAFDALARDAGVIRADTLDDAVELTELVAHTARPLGRRLGAITLSGAYRGLLLDAAERNGVTFPALAPETKSRLDAVLGVGSLVSNPIDGGFGVLTSADAYRSCIEALQSDPNVDMVLLQEALPRAPGSDRGERYIRMVEGMVAANPQKPVGFVTLTSHGQSGFSRALRNEARHVPFLQEANKALRAIAACADRDAAETLSRISQAAYAPTPEQAAVAETLRKWRAAGVTTLDEVRSKDILRRFGLATSKERVARNVDEAAAAARSIGYPVVLKAVSSTLVHKSDAGAVLLDLADDAAVRVAWARIERSVAAHEVGHRLEGMLVAQQVPRGVELVLGVHRDAEVGPVVMVGAGGVLVELVRDVRFAAPPISPDKARRMFGETRVARLLGGYRGAERLDADFVSEALVKLGLLAQTIGGEIESIDINPFVVFRGGGFALDAAIILRRPDAERPS